jgi:hypothetical protein
MPTRIFRDKTGNIKILLPPGDALRVAQDVAARALRKELTGAPLDILGVTIAQALAGQRPGLTTEPKMGD